MLPPRHLSQIKRYAQTKSKALGGGISCKRREGKKAGVAVLISDKIDFKTKAIAQRQRMTLYNDKGNNPTRGYIPSKYFHTQHGST